MTDKYGSNSAQVEAFLALLPTLTGVQKRKARRAWRDAWDAVWDAWEDAWDAAEIAGLEDAMCAALEDAYDANDDDDERDAAWCIVALVVRDLISREHFDTLTCPARAAGIDVDTLGAAS